MKKNGFTFVELLVVITIMAVVFVAGVVSYTTISRNARNARRKADLEAIRQAMEMCRSIDGTYPVSIYDTVTCASGAVTLKATPLDPKCTTAPQYTLTTLAGGYRVTASCYEGGTLSVENP